MKPYHLLTAVLALAAFALPSPAQSGPYGPPYRGDQPPPRQSYVPRRDTPPPPPPPARTGRHVWAYGQGDRLDFRQLEGRRWVEEASDGNYYYREVERTPDYIQLIDPDRQASVRLYANAMYSHGPGDPNWYFGQPGHWVR